MISVRKAVAAARVNTSSSPMGGYCASSSESMIQQEVAVRLERASAIAITLFHTRSRPLSPKPRSRIVRSYPMFSMSISSLCLVDESDIRTFQVIHLVQKTTWIRRSL
jgi:hypothetical protein